MSDQSDHATLVILAGGLGSRMGMPKAHLQVAGQPILSWMLKRIGWHGPTMLALTPAVSTAPGMELFDQCVVDPIDGLGPARGLLTAMDHARSLMICVLTVDMPCVDKRHLDELVKWLVADPLALGLMCRVDGKTGAHIEPFPSAFRINAAEAVRSELLAGRRSVQNLSRLPAMITIAAPDDWSSAVWTNLNTPAEFAEFTRQK